jgi:DNA polymerase-3 subunit epsilon
MVHRWIVVDLETTGMFPDRDRIIEIAAFDPLNDKKFVELTNPGMPIPRESTNINAISDEMVKDAAPFAQVGKRFCDFCQGEVALVAHNGQGFDFPFLDVELKRAGLSLPEETLYIDSLIWARHYRRDLPRHSLQYLRGIYGVAPSQAHRALNDVMALYEVFCHFVDDLSPKAVACLLEKISGSKRETKGEAPPARPGEEALCLFH